MWNKIRNYIEKHHLLDKSHLYIVALSGGADSVALLRVLLLLGYRVEAAHCNFNLRGAESDRDEAFVVNLCEQLSVPLHRAHFDTTTYAQLHKVSIEMAARQLRYRYFEQLRKDMNAEAVCVAHHRDDNVETLLINLLRGTGIHGLTGIQPRRDSIEATEDNTDACTVIRPMLCVSRTEILEWLKSIHQDFVTDSSNLVDDVLRNKIRLDVIPLLQQINPAVMDNLQRTIEQMNEAEKIYDAYTCETLAQLIDSNDSDSYNNSQDSQRIDIERLKLSPSPLCMLFEWLTPYGFSAATIRQIANHLDSPCGRFWKSSTHEICIDRNMLLLSTISAELPTMCIPEIGTYVYTHDIRFRFNIEENIVVDRSPNVACLDAKKVVFPLTIRPIQEGDRFIPLGMAGNKLLSDFLTDLKVPVIQKRRQLVVCDANGSIVWVVNRRPSAQCCINEFTERMLKISIVHS